MTLQSKYIYIKSNVTLLDNVDWQYIKEEMCSSTVVCWLFDQLIWGSIDAGGSLSFSDDNFKEPDTADIIEMRIFNTDKEIYLRRNGESFMGRMRVDSQGDNIQVVDSDNYLWGTSAMQKGDYTLLEEDNGMQLLLPGSYPNVTPDNRVKLVIRNYIEYNERHMAGYVDARFVKIEM